MNKVAIVTDTVSLMSQEVADEFNIRLAPLSVILDGKSYPETEIDLAWFYKQIPQWKESGKMPTTSSVSVGDFLEAYRELSRKAEAILCITHGSKFGMSPNAAMQAKKIAGEELPQTAIKVIDSYTACGGQMLIAIEAARAATAGKSLPEVIELVNNMIKRVNYVLLSDDLSLLAKGGRAHKGSVWANSQITNTALLEANISTGGGHKPLARCRIKGQALEKLFEIVKQRSGNGKLHVAINHADVPAEAEQLKELSLSRFQCVEVFITPIYPLITTHTGLGTRNYSWWSED